MYAYLKMEMYSKPLRKIGILEEATKKPANNMNGMINTGVSVTASCLSEKPAEITSA